MGTRQLRQKTDQLIKDGEYEKIKPLLLSYKDITEHDNELAMTCYLCTIYEQEAEAGQATIFDKVSDVAELLERYTRLKFYLRKIEFDVLDEGMTSFYSFLSEYRISSYELLRVIDFSIVHKEKVLQAVKGEAAGGNAYSADDGEPLENADNEVQEICFVICTNNRLYAQECIHYINHLIVPDGIRVDVLTVEEADSLASAYNEAMQYSKAKYKVYLHHDTFIIYPDFIKECLKIFRKNPQVGMIGNIGVQKMPASGVMWDADRFGMVYEQHIYETELLANALPTDAEYMKMEAIDGFLMVTQYDIPWREDLFTKWDFYDCSQSMEFIRNGYDVVVPNMKLPWCVHDCGFINLENYEGERKKFVQEYLIDV